VGKIDTKKTGGNRKKKRKKDQAANCKKGKKGNLFKRFPSERPKLQGEETTSPERKDSIAMIRGSSWQPRQRVL